MKTVWTPDAEASTTHHCNGGLSAVILTVLNAGTADR